MSQQTQQSAAQGAGQVGGAAGNSPEAQRAFVANLVASAAVPPSAPDGAAPTGDGAARPPATATGKVLVDWGGAQREVAIDELVSLARESEAAKAAAEAAKTLLNQHVGAQGIVQFMQQLAPEDRAAFQKIMQRPDLLRSLRAAPQQAAAPRDPVDDLIDDMPAAPPRGSAEGDRIAQLERGMQLVSSLLMERLQTEQQQTVASSVDSTMAQFPVFRDLPPEGVGFAKDAILREIAAAGEKANVQDIVAKSATRMHQIVQGARQGVVAPQPSFGPRGSLFREGDQPPSGKDLESGSTLGSLRRHLAMAGVDGYRMRP